MICRFHIPLSAVAPSGVGGRKLYLIQGTLHRHRACRTDRPFTVSVILRHYPAVFSAEAVESLMLLRLYSGMGLPRVDSLAVIGVAAEAAEVNPQRLASITLALV